MPSKGVINLFFNFNKYYKNFTVGSCYKFYLSFPVDTLKNEYLGHFNHIDCDKYLCKNSYDSFYFGSSVVSSVYYFYPVDDSIIRNMYIVQRKDDGMLMMANIVDKNDVNIQFRNGYKNPLFVANGVMDILEL